MIRKSPGLRAVVVGVLAAVTIAICMAGPSTVVGDSAGLSMVLPDEILGMVGRVEKASQSEKDVLPSDTEFEKRTYVSEDGKRAMFYSIVLSGESRNSIHRPEICLPGQGWSMPRSLVRRIVLPGGKVLDVKNIYLEREIEDGQGGRRKLRAHYYYWFVGRDVTTPHHLSRILLTSYDNVFRNVNHRWAYVSLMSLVGESIYEGGMNSEETMLAMDEFLAASVQEFQSAL